MTLQDLIRNPNLLDELRAKLPTSEAEAEQARYDEDFEKLGEEIERHPICNPGMYVKKSA